MTIPKMIFIVLLILVAESTAGPVSCVSDYRTIGCFNGAENLLTTELVNNRDIKSQFFSGILVNWKDFGASIHILACRCSEKAKAGGFKFFGIRFYGVCYGGNDISALKQQLAGDTGENNFVNGNFAKCLASDLEYVYEVTEVVDGGFSDWSSFSECTVTCGDGVKTRERTCTNPEPEGEDAKDCSVLGSYAETKSCHLSECEKEIPCAFVTGDGTGEGEINIGYKDTISDCKRACAAKKLENPKINGVTIPSKIDGKVNCYCEIGMTGNNSASAWQTCFMLLPEDGKLSDWSAFSECSASCGGGHMHRTRTCTPPKRGGKQQCNSSLVESIACREVKCPDFACKFIKGDGIGGPEIYIGYKGTVAQCINECIAKRATYPDINGVTIPLNGNVYCYCERKMTGSIGSELWRTCLMLLPEDGKLSDWSAYSECSASCGGGHMQRTRTCTPPKRGGKHCNASLVESKACNEVKCPDFACKFINGVHIGGQEIYIGYKETVAQCINECIAKRATYPDINGVTIPQTGSVNCYCERKMTGLNGSGSWKTCKFLTLEIL